jgi:SAM-dependent methyltransferase
MAATGAAQFDRSGAAYDLFMGRYSLPLAGKFAEVAGVAEGQRGLDIGCGPGALTGVLAGRLGAANVVACDPSEQFVVECLRRHPGVDVRMGSAEALPLETDSVDVALAQLVLHFVSQPEVALSEACRVVRTGGVIAACVWDFAGGMEMLRAYWDAALSVDANAPDEATTMRFGREAELSDLFAAGGLVGVREDTLEVTSTYADFDQLWAGFLGGVGPAGSHLTSLSDPQRALVKAALFDRVGEPSGSFTLRAIARFAVGMNPG